MDIQVRNISPEDAAHVKRLSEQLGYSISLEETSANIKEVMILKNHVAFVAIANHEIIGWVHAFKTTTIESLPFIEMAGLVVDDRHRSKGIGKLLTDQIKQWCIQQNVPLLRVRSNVIRKEAHKFYLNNGFTEIKEQKVFQMKL